MKLFTRWAVCLGALYLASVCFPDSFRVYGSLVTFAAAATILWLANLTVRPVLRILSLPITIATFGIFSLVLSAAMVKLTDLVIPTIQIRGFGVCLFTAIIIAGGNSVFSVNSKKKG